MTTETEFNISEEPLAERVLRQVQSGQLDESRLLHLRPPAHDLLHRHDLRVPLRGRWRIPALTPAAERRAAENQARRRDHPADSWTDRNLWERCIIRGTPRVPNNYNSNILLLQTPDSVVLLNEMINETRVVSLDGRPHVASGVRLWNGDSRGRWEGDTLVVETTNFSAKQVFRGLSVDDLRLVERFTRTGPNSIDYEMTLSDPATYTRDWTIVLPMIANGGGMFEYACHEGNYGMEGILAGHRAEELAIQ